MLGHDARHHGFRGCGTEGQQEFLAGVLEELPQRNPGEAPGHDEQETDKHHRGAVTGGNQHGVGAEGVQTVLADDEGHRTEGPDRRNLHDPGHDLENQLEDRLHEADHREALLPADEDNGGAEED